MILTSLSRIETPYWASSFRSHSLTSLTSTSCHTYITCKR